ncbi:hypothetical protein Tco_0751417 [Tanacetum coccineum]|uniref:Uncharacterized protein n=1 Tax=Tanacetum coccineum TaxID=301880 RepID=A0ABQ4Z557_9ASTR
MIEPKKPLKKKDQVVADEEYARQVAVEMQAKVKEEERIRKEKEEAANLALIELFKKEMKRVNTFIPMDQDEESLKKDKSESKRVGEELESDVSKKQKLDEQVESDKHEEVEEDDEAEVKRYLQIVREEDIPIDAIPLASKPPMIVEYKIIKEGIFGHFKPEDEFERVLLGDLKVMFEPDIKSEVWRSLQGYTVVGWKFFDSCGVHHTVEYGVSNSSEYAVSDSLSNTAYSSHQINTAYPLLLDTMRHFKSLSLDELRSPDFNLLSDQENSEEEEEEMAETMEQYMSKTRIDYGSGVSRPKIDDKDQFELNGQFLKDL